MTATAGSETATASIDIPPLGVTPPPSGQLTASIPNVTWALLSGTAGQAGAVYQAQPTIRVSGGQAPHPVQWLTTDRLHSGGTSRTATYRFTATASALYPGAFAVSCRVTDGSTPQQSFTANGTIADYPSRPPAAPQLTGSIASVSWGLVSGTAGQAGAVYQAHPTMSVSGGTAPHTFQWAGNSLLVSGGTSRTALFRFTASASNLYPDATTASCTARDGSTPQQSVTASGSIAAYPRAPAPPTTPTADLSVAVSASRWTAVRIGGYVRYLSGATANASGGTGGYQYNWQVSGAAITSYANSPSISLRSFNGAAATVSCTVTDSAGTSISGSANIPQHGGVNV